MKGGVEVSINVVDICISTLPIVGREGWRGMDGWIEGGRESGRG